MQEGQTPRCLPEQNRESGLLALAGLARMPFSIVILQFPILFFKYVSVCFSIFPLPTSHVTDTFSFPVNERHPRRG